MLRAAAFAVVGLLSSGAWAQEDQASIALGEKIARIGGCHDCHTAGYNEAAGEINPAKALTGSPVGYNGPWGTTYAANLRITAAEHSEDEWVEFLSTLKARPPMPWFNLPYLEEIEMRSLHMYIVSLGEPGEPAPAFTPPGTPPATPFIVMAPPTMPQ